jgi:hypothetical protein
MVQGEGCMRDFDQPQHRGRSAGRSGKFFAGRKLVIGKTVFACAAFLAAMAAVLAAPAHADTTDDLLKSLRDKGMSWAGWPRWRATLRRFAAASCRASWKLKSPPNRVAGNVGAHIAFYPGIDSVTGVGGANSPGSPTAFFTTGIDVRRNYLTVGYSGFGELKIGRDIGLFGADAALNDMTLLGAGSASPTARRSSSASH